MAGKNEQTEKVWSKEEIFKMWPQAAGELRGFQRALEAKAGITAAQLGMANWQMQNFRDCVRTTRRRH